MLIKLLAAQRDPYTFSADKLFRKDPDLAGKEQPERWGEWVEINLRLARVLRKTGQHRRAEIVLGPTLTVATYLSFGSRGGLKYRVMAAHAPAAGPAARPIAPAANSSRACVIFVPRPTRSASARIPVRRKCYHDRLGNPSRPRVRRCWFENWSASEKEARCSPVAPCALGPCDMTRG